MSAADPLLVPDCNLLIHLVAEQFLRAKHRQPPLGLLDAGHDSSDFAVRDLAAAFEDGSVALSDASLGGLWRYLTDKSRKVPQDLATRYTYELEDLAADSSHYYDHLTWAALEADADQVIHAWETRCPSIVANGQVDFEDAVQSSAYAHIFDANHGRAVVFATADVRFALAQAHTNPNPHNPTRLYRDVRGTRAVGHTLPKGTLASFVPEPSPPGPNPVQAQLRNEEIQHIALTLHRRTRQSLDRGR